jgi:hypothetical protein
VARSVEPPGCMAPFHSHFPIISFLTKSGA